MVLAAHKTDAVALEVGVLFETGPPVGRLINALHLVSACVQVS